MDLIPCSKVCVQSLYLKIIKFYPCGQLCFIALSFSSLGPPSKGPHSEGRWPDVCFCFRLSLFVQFLQPTVITSQQYSFNTFKCNNFCLCSSDISKFQPVIIKTKSWVQAHLVTYRWATVNQGIAFIPT